MRDVRRVRGKCAMPSRACAPSRGWCAPAPTLLCAAAATLTQVLVTIISIPNYAQLDPTLTDDETAPSLELMTRVHTSKTALGMAQAISHVQLAAMAANNGVRHLTPPRM